MKTRTEKNKKLIKEQKKIKKEKRKKKRKKILIILLLIFILIILYAFLIEPHLLNVNEYKIKSSEISNSFHGLKIVHFSDLHYGTSINKNNIDKIIEKINSLNPDILIFTGDLIDNNYKINNKELAIFEKKLKKLNSKLGKYAVIGNHDYYNKNYEEIINTIDFKLLKNDFDYIYYKDNNPLLIYGLENITYGNPTMDNLTEEVKQIPFKILILHEGDYIKNIINNYDFDIIMAGHSHNGQINIYKPIYLPNYAKVYYDEYYKENNTEIFISNGIGTSIIPFRLGSTPSINLYRLTKIKTA